MAASSSLTRWSKNLVATYVCAMVISFLVFFDIDPQNQYNSLHRVNLPYALSWVECLTRELWEHFGLRFFTVINNVFTMFRICLIDCNRFSLEAIVFLLLVGPYKVWLSSASFFISFSTARPIFFIRHSIQNAKMVSPAIFRKRQFGNSSFSTQIEGFSVHFFRP